MAAVEIGIALPEQRSADALVQSYNRVRAASLAISEPLETEDYVVQSMPDVSPVKWHLAHTSWFFEQFLLQPLLRGYLAFDPQYEYLFNSYYESVGRMHQRSMRGLITRPTVTEVLHYREHVDEHMNALMQIYSDDAEVKSLI